MNDYSKYWLDPNTFIIGDFQMTKQELFNRVSGTLGNSAANEIERLREGLSELATAIGSRYDRSVMRVRAREILRGDEGPSADIPECRKGKGQKCLRCGAGSEWLE